MHAVQFAATGGPEVLQLVELPDPEPGPGEVLIRVEAAAVNFADVVRRAGLPYPFPTPLPFVPGSEVAGVVESLGAGVDGPPVGTRVFALAGRGGEGGYAELAVAAAPAVIPVPSGIDVAQAAGIIVAGTTAALVLTRAARISPGDAVLVPAAAGGVGSFAVQIAKLHGAGTVIGLASTAAKRGTARALGADHALDPADPAWPDRVRAITGGRGVDVALEATGGDQLDRTLRVLAPFGTAVVYGMASGTPGRVADDTLARLLHDPAENQAVMAFNLGGWFAHRPEQAGEVLGELVGMIASGAVRVHVGATYPLRDAARVHRLLAERAATGKIVLTP